MQGVEALVSRPSDEFFNKLTGAGAGVLSPLATSQLHGTFFLLPWKTKCIRSFQLPPTDAYPIVRLDKNGDVFLGLL